MYKKAKRSWHKHFDFIVFDILCMQAAYIISYMLQHGAGLPYSVGKYRIMAGILILITICVIGFTEGYEGILRRGSLSELKSVVKHVTLVMLVAVAYMFFAGSYHSFSRIVFLYTWGLSILMSLAERLLLKRCILARLGKIDNQRSIIVITSFESAEEVLTKMGQEPHPDFKITGICILDSNKHKSYIKDIPVIATSDMELVNYLKGNVVDEVFLNLPPQIKLPEYILDSCMEMGITTHLNIRRLSQANENRIVEEFAGYTVMTSSIKLTSTTELFLKRMMDICGSIVGLLVTGVAFLIVAPIIYKQDPGPIFFSQERVGKNGRKFRIYKFRSMYMDAEARKKELMAQNEMNG
ncbi:MAG: sugar transferase, partial [Lachnospiraceae bacterium]|nr:sugar transferase [Lachnospiraceae bacterium]